MGLPGHRRLQADVPVADVPVADVPVADVPVTNVPVTDVPVPDVPVPGSTGSTGGSSAGVHTRAGAASVLADTGPVIPLKLNITQLRSIRASRQM